MIPVTKNRMRLEVALLILSIVMLVFAGRNLLGRITFEAEGQILRSEVRCVVPPDQRCVPVYVVRSSSDQPVVSYLVIPGYLSLPNSLKPGTTIRKRKWQFSYELNGHPSYTFAASDFLVPVLLGVTGLLASILIHVRGRERSTR